MLTWNPSANGRFISLDTGLKDHIGARLICSSRFGKKGGELVHNTEFYLDILQEGKVIYTLQLKRFGLKGALNRANHILTTGGYLAQSEEVQLG